MPLMALRGMTHWLLVLCFVCAGCCPLCPINRAGAAQPVVFAARRVGPSWGLSNVEGRMPHY